MSRAQIVKAPSTTEKWFSTTTKNTNLSQRETLEEIMINLATLFGVNTIYKQINSRGTYFYQVQNPHFGSFQSASNTILELSRALSKCKESI